MKTERDAFGQMLMAGLRGASDREIIEREDGFVNVGWGASVYFAPYEAWSPIEQEAMTHVRGRVLDVGCGAGRHALYLQAQGHEVVGVDASPLAVEVCRERGLRDAWLIPITRLNRAVGSFDTITMLGNNFGLVGGFKRARWLLRRFHALTNTEGRIIASSLNPYGTTEPAHLAYHAWNRQRGRMGGQVRFRVRFRQFCDAWMDYLLVSPDEMRSIVEGTGWQITTLLGDPEGSYIAVVDKR